MRIAHTTRNTSFFQYSHRSTDRIDCMFCGVNGKSCSHMAFRYRINYEYTQMKYHLEPIPYHSPAIRLANVSYASQTAEEAKQQQQKLSSQTSNHIHNTNWLHINRRMHKLNWKIVNEWGGVGHQGKYQAKGETSKWHCYRMSFCACRTGS